MSDATIAAVVFDLDGVLVESEELWNDARRAIAGEHGGRWPDGAKERMMGMSSPEWSAFLHDELGVQLAPAEINERVVARMLELYERELPLLPGAVAAVRRLAARWPLGLASSANRPVIEAALRLAGVEDAFRAVLSSEEVDRGKPAPDVYLAAAAELGVAAGDCAAVEDSSNGLRSAHAAGMAVVAIPNRGSPPEDDALALAGVTLPGLEALTAEAIEAAAAARRE